MTGTMLEYEATAPQAAVFVDDTQQAAATPTPQQPQVFADRALAVWDDVAPTISVPRAAGDAGAQGAQQAHGLMTHEPLPAPMQSQQVVPQVEVHHPAPMQLQQMYVQPAATQHTLGGSPAYGAGHIVGGGPTHHELMMTHGALQHGHGYAMPQLQQVGQAMHGMPVHVAVQQHGGMYPQVLAMQQPQLAMAGHGMRPMLAPQPARRDHVFGLAAGLLILAVLLTGGVAMERGTKPKPAAPQPAAATTAATTTPVTTATTTTAAGAIGTATTGTATTTTPPGTAATGAAVTSTTPAATSGAGTGAAATTTTTPKTPAATTTKSAADKQPAADSHAADNSNAASVGTPTTTNHSHAGPPAGAGAPPNVSAPK